MENKKHITVSDIPDGMRFDHSNFIPCCKENNNKGIVASAAIPDAIRYSI